MRYMIAICVLLMSRGFAYSLDYGNILAHIELKLAQGSVMSDPFPHLVIEGILPEDFYQALVAEKPHAQGAPSSNSDLWRFFSTEIVNKVLKRRLAERFRPYIQARFGTSVQGFSVCNALEEKRPLIPDFYSLMPRVDPGFVFAPVMIYLPDVNDATPFQIMLLNHKQQKLAFDVDHAGWSEVRVAKYIVPARNTLISFIRTNNAWYGSFLPIDLDRGFYTSPIYLSEAFMKWHFNYTFQLKESGVVLDEQNTY